jgi:hypothetical protein
MGIQEILVILLFVIALFYIGRVVYRTFQSKKGCGTNCKCGIDFSDVHIPDQRS